MNKQSYRIAQIGTFDLKNYGDILFPDVLSTELPKYLNVEEIVLFSPIGGNKPFDQRTVLPISSLEQEHLKKPFDAIIIGGGALIRLDQNVISNSDKYSPQNSSEELWIPAILLGYKYHIPVLFNAPGVPFGFSITEQKYVELVLKTVDYISVRDAYSAENLRECIDKQIKVIPDSIFLVLQTYCKEKLEVIFKRLCKEFGFPKRYVLFQCNGIEPGLNVSEYDGYLKQIEKWTDSECWFMPIGYVHEDREVLQKINKTVKDSYPMIERELSPEEMLSVIGHAVAFIGTSYHGCLTAMVQDVPAVAINHAFPHKANGLRLLAGMEPLEKFSVKTIREDMLHDLLCLSAKEQLIKDANEHMRKMAEIIQCGKQQEISISEASALLTYQIESASQLNNRISKVYWATDDHMFNEQQSKIFRACSEDEKIEIELALPSKIKMIRFDPVEDGKCAVADVHAEDANGNKLPLVAHNGLSLGEYILFDTTDPQLLLAVKTELTSPVKIHCRYVKFTENSMNLIKDTTNEKENELKELHQKFSAELQELKELNQKLSAESQELKAAFDVVQHQYNVVTSSFMWRMTAPLRAVLDFLKKNLRNTPLRLVYRVLKYWKRYGLKVTVNQVIRRLKCKIASQKGSQYSTEELKKQRSTVFNKKIKFSIVVPLYNTPEYFLREMIQSVINQTYANWELCMADGSDEQHSDVGKICKEYSKKDSRIRYQKLEKNLGISGNTNACIDMATGDYIGLFDHDDLLHPAALYENMKAICEKDADFIYTDENTFHNKPADAFNPHFKPDYAPDTLRANNYICHFTVFKKSLLDITGGFRPECDGSQDFDLVLRLTEQAKHIVHIPKVLYYWRAHKNSVAEDVSAKPYVIEAAHKAVEDHLKRVGLEGEVLNSRVPSMYRLKYKINGNPMVSILIPNKDYIEDLDRCLKSIFTHTTYQNYEIIIIENNSEKKETFEYYKQYENHEKVRVVTWDGIFNYSAINNYGYQHAQGEYILLLNNDTEVISPDWIQEMLMYAQRTDVGAVGAKLYYPDHTIQHAGIGIGLLTLAGHYHRHFDGNHPGYMGRLSYAQNLSAVTGACMMIPRRVYEEVNGLDETFVVAFNDVDVCMRIRQKGYLVVFTPFAELWHYESKSRGLDDTGEKRKRFVDEVTRFQKRWDKELTQGDPYYNPNFSLEKEDFSIQL